jgi:ribosome-associated protein
VDDLIVSPALVIPAAELRLSFSRSGGPGGQNVNKVATKVELRWAPAASAALTEPERERLLRRLGGRVTGDGDLLVTSSRTRDQARNREDARRKLASLILGALARPKLRKRTTPTPSAIQERLRQKKQRARIKLERRDAPPAD